MLRFALPSCAGGGDHVKKRRGRKAAIQGVLHTHPSGCPGSTSPRSELHGARTASPSKITETHPAVPALSHCSSVPAQEARGNGYCALDRISGLSKYTTAFHKNLWGVGGLSALHMETILSFLINVPLILLFWSEDLQILHIGIFLQWITKLVFIFFSFLK